MIQAAPLLLLTALAQLQPGYAFDMGGAAYSLDKGPAPSGDGFLDSTHNALGIRFTAHQSGTISSVGIAVPKLGGGGAPDNYSVDLYSAESDGGLGTLIGNLGTFSANLSPPTWAQIASSSGLSATAGTPYFLLFTDTSLASQMHIAPSVAPVASAVDPRSGSFEPFTRDVFYGTDVLNTGIITLSDLGLEPMFYVVYAVDDPNSGTCGTLFFEDGSAYVGASGPSPDVHPGQSYVEAFETQGIVEEQQDQPTGAGIPLPLKVFAIETPVTVTGVGVPTVSLIVEDGGAFGSGLAIDTSLPYGNPGPPPPASWARAFISSADRGAAVLSYQSAEWQISIANLQAKDHFDAYLLSTLDTSNACSTQNRLVFLGGYQYAHVTAPNGATPEGTSIPFRLCSSEIPDNGIDEDCSGADESADQLLHLCRDALGSGHGDPADSLDLSSATYTDNLPPGYVQDCTLCVGADGGDLRDPPSSWPGCDGNACRLGSRCELIDGGGACVPGSTYDDDPEFADGGTDPCAAASATLDAGLESDGGNCFILGGQILNGLGAGYGGSQFSLSCDGGLVAGVLTDGGTALDWGDVAAQVCADTGSLQATCQLLFGDGGSSNTVVVTFPGGPTSSSSSSSVSSSTSSTSSSSASSVGSSSVSSTSATSSAGSGPSTSSTSGSTGSGKSAGSSSQGSSLASATGSSGTSGSAKSSRGSTSGASSGISASGASSAAATLGSGGTTAVGTAVTSTGGGTTIEGTTIGSSGTGRSASGNSSAGSSASGGSSGGTGTSRSSAVSASSASGSRSSSSGSASAVAGSSSGRANFQLGGCGCGSTEGPLSLAAWVLLFARRRRSRRRG